MSEMISWLAGGSVAVAVAGLLVGFTAWLRFLDNEAEHCHHKRQDGHGP